MFIPFFFRKSTLPREKFIDVPNSIFSFWNIEIYVCEHIKINTIIPNCDKNGINGNRIEKYLGNKNTNTKNDVGHNNQNMQNGGLTIIFCWIN